MTENSEIPDSKRNIWIRGLFMLFMGLAFHVCVTVLGIVAFIQFAMTLLTDAPNVRLTAFGRSMGNYVVPLRRLADGRVSRSVYCRASSFLSSLV